MQIKTYSLRILSALLLSAGTAADNTKGNCLNNQVFRQYGAERRSCSWIRNVEARRQKACLNEDVLRNCPQTCGECCENDPSYTFVTDLGLTKNCEWVGQIIKRQKKYCDQWKSGGVVKNLCPLACGLCKPPVNKPPPSGACNDNVLFRYKDKVDKSCEWIGRVSSRRENACSNEDVVKNCPRSCRTCCQDDSSFMLETNGGQVKKCTWLKGNSSRKERYCKNLNNGVLVENKCPVSCGICIPDDTPKPSPSPTSKPTPFPTKPPCRRLEDTSFILETNNGREKKCFWLRDNPDRQERYCKTRNNGFVVESKCPVSCGTCIPDATPKPSPSPTSLSSSPSGSPISILSSNPSSAPTLGSSSFIPSANFSAQPSKPPFTSTTERPSENPSESGLCQIDAILSFPSLEDAYDGYHNDELSVRKEGSSGECSIINQTRRWCKHSGEDGFIHNDPYYDTFISQSESVNFIAEPDILYTLRVDHKFINSEPFLESYYGKDHLMAGTLKIEANGNVIGDGYRRDVYEDVDMHLGFDEDKKEYIINPEYDALMEVTVSCDDECQCVATALEDTSPPSSRPSTIPTPSPSHFRPTISPSISLSSHPSSTHSSTPSESGLCQIDAILSFPSLEDAFKGYHNDELSVRKEGSSGECSIINQTRRWCEHSGEDGLIHNDPYYQTFISQSESVNFIADPDILYTLRVDHKFINTEPFLESYYGKDHLMAGTLKIEANGNVIGDGYRRDVYEDVDMHLGFDLEKEEYIINPEYDALMEVTVSCDDECQCVIEKTK